MSNSQPGPLFHLGYVSTETGGMGTQDMVELMMEAEVRRTFASIEKDERHTAVDVLFDGEIEEREFEDWRMGFLNLDGVELETLQGYSDFLSREDNSKDFLENLSRGKRLALMFRSME